MNHKSRLKKIDKMLTIDLSKCSLFAIEYPSNPEKSTYSVWNGVEGSGHKRVTKDEWERLAEQIEDSHSLNIVRGGCQPPIVKIIDDIPKS